MIPKSGNRFSDQIMLKCKIGCEWYNRGRSHASLPVKFNVPGPLSMVDSTSPERAAMYSSSRLQIGLFGPNCSSGRAVTMVPERWSGSWPDNLKLARMADDAGIDFLLPIARWKGYGGDTDYQGATLETLTWASGLLASTKRITVF